MKNRHDIIRALYDELDAPDLLRGDPALREEYEALSEVKARLDRRVKQRPDADVLERVISAAGSSGPRADRRPLARRGARFRALWASSAATAVVALLAISLWQFEQLAPGRETVVRVPVAVAPADDNEMTARPADDRDKALVVGPAGENAKSAGAAPDRDQALAVGPAGQGAMTAGAAPETHQAPATAKPAEVPITGTFANAQRAAAGGVQAQQAALLADAASMPDSTLHWDDAGDVLEVHRAIERLQVGVDLAWDEPVVPLEMLRAGSPARGLQEAGRRQ